jgi:nucleoside-diphosphate-sugar epimerase
MITLVTGATGFVGSHLARTLASRGAEVRALARSPERAAALAASGIEVVRGDMEDAGSLRAAVEGVDRVYHCAAMLGDWLDPARARSVNVDGTRRLMEAAVDAGVRRVIHLSSLSVLGTRHHHGTDEDGPYVYGDPYTDTKIDSERVVRRFGRRGRIETVCIRPGFVYGPEDHQLIPQLLEGVAAGRFRYVGDGSKEMNAVYIDDLVDVLLRADAPQAAGQVYNVTDGANSTITEFVTCLCECVGTPAPTGHVPVPIALAACLAFEGTARLMRAKKAPLVNRSRLRFIYYNQRFSIEKARRELGYEPRFTYREGLPRTVAWFRAAGLVPASLAPALPSLAHAPA